MKHLLHHKFFQIFPALIILFALHVCFAIPPAQALPVKLKLNQESSTAKVDLVSAMMSTNATLKKMSGFLTITGDQPEDFELFVSARGDDVALGSLPFDQMILVSGLLRTVVNKDVSFQSTGVTKKGSNYLLTGIATSGKNRNEVTIPAVILIDKNQRTVETTYTHSGFIGGENNEIGKMFGKIQAKSKLNLVFVE